MSLHILDFQTTKTFPSRLIWLLTLFLMCLHWRGGSRVLPGYPGWTWRSRGRSSPSWPSRSPYPRRPERHNWSTDRGEERRIEDIRRGEKDRTGRRGERVGGGVGGGQDGRKKGVREDILGVLPLFEWSLAWEYLLQLNGLINNMTGGLHKNTGNNEGKAGNQDSSLESKGESQPF